MRKNKILNEAKKYIKKTLIGGLYIVKRSLILDNRGGFRMVALHRELEVVLGRKFAWAQVNHSWSEPRVVRGIHSDPWDKLAFPITGRVFLAIADIRPESRTFMKVEKFIFEEGKTEPFALFISKDLGNSLCNFGNTPVHYVYLVNDYWDGTYGSGERGIAWNDPDLKVSWPVKDPILSEADKNHKFLRERYPEKFK